MHKQTVIIGLSLILFLIGLDQVTKYSVASNMVLGQSIELISGFLYITYHHNAGAAWGMMQGATMLFVIITVIALVFFGYLARDAHIKTKPLYTIGIILLIAGTLGNFIDRITMNYVIDFINVYIFGYDFPIFNVADICLTIGMILFAYEVLINESRKEVRHG